MIGYIGNTRELFLFDDFNGKTGREVKIIKYGPI